MRPGSTKPVVALDLDGTIGDYHTHFTNFAEAWVGRKMPSSESINPGLALHKHLHMSKGTYRDCKLAYRQGGMKRSMPVYEGAKALTHSLRRAGAEVWICTTRPWLRLDNIDPDTRHWMRRHGIQYDGVLYGEHKYRDLARNVGAERVIAVLDDLPELCAQACSLGLPAFLRDQPYNRHVQDFPRVISLWDWRIAMLESVQQFKEMGK